jgi:spermidine synthase
MKPSVLLDTAQVLDNGQPLRLYQHDKDFSIKEGTAELMNSRMHGSEDALAQLACKEMEKISKPWILIGGLGMGFTLRAALDALPADAQVEVAELIPEVVKWNQGVLAPLAGNPLADPRVTLHLGDVVKKIKDGNGKYSAILLDVDNGPQRLFRKGNDKLYNLSGLYSAHAALRTGGIFAVWSSGPDKDFTWRLQKVGFGVAEVRVHARAGSKAGGHHLIWVAKKSARHYGNS